MAKKHKKKKSTRQQSHSQYKGKYQAAKKSPATVAEKEPLTWKTFRMPWWSVPAAFFLIELVAYFFLAKAESPVFQGWPLVFGLLWAVILYGPLRALPAKVSRVVFGILYFLMVVYVGFQTGYYELFKEMMWVSEFRYASEGSDYASVLLSYPVGWWISIVVLLAVGVLLVWKYPRRKQGWPIPVVAMTLACAAGITAFHLPKAAFGDDSSIKYAASDYGRAQAAEAAYENMFNTHRLYQICGVYQTMYKDVYANYIFPLTPAYASAQKAAAKEIDAYFASRQEGADNEMTGIFEGKNVVLVLMESMDDWALGEHTPTINRLMAEGINFTNFYTPGYGGVRTFNSEFCINTGSFLSSQGGYAFDYVTNNYKHSLASLLEKQGYSSKVYHYNDPNFYSRGVFSKAMGYEEYVYYGDYLGDASEKELYDDQFLFNYTGVSDSFFRDGQKLNFIITRSAHLSYKYNEVLSYWALKKYPEYKGMTGHEEEDCMYLKARLVDDLFARLLAELEANGELENTVIIAVTDHYSYGVKDEQLVLDRSGVDDMLLVEKTPCFIWSADGISMEVDKVLNTADLLPTVLNMMGLKSDYDYLGRDAFDEGYIGYALFPNGSWVCDGIAYNASTDRTMILEEGREATEEFMVEMMERVNEFVRINNLILQTDYYDKK